MNQDFVINPVLGQAVGMQWRGIVDHTETQSIGTLTQPLIIGKFKRGVLNSVMTVTQANIKALLGYTPENPHYQNALKVVDANGVAQVLCVGKYQKS